MATDNKNNFLLRWEQLKTLWEKLLGMLRKKANDSEVVHLAGNETVTGTKTFANVSGKTRGEIGFGSGSEGSSVLGYRQSPKPTDNDYNSTINNNSLADTIYENYWGLKNGTTSAHVHFRGNWTKKISDILFEGTKTGETSWWYYISDNSSSPTVISDSESHQLISGKAVYDYVKSKDDAVVHKAGEEVVAGKKSFTAGIVANVIEVKKEAGVNKKAMKLSMEPNATAEGENCPDLIISEKLNDSNYTSIAKVSSRGSLSGTILNSKETKNSDQLVTAKAVHDYLAEYYCNEVLELTTDDIGKYLMPCNDVNVKPELSGGGGPYRRSTGRYLLVLDKEYKAVIHQVPVISTDPNIGPFTTHSYYNYLSNSYSNSDYNDFEPSASVSWPCLAKKVEVDSVEDKKKFKWESIIVHAVIPCGVITELSNNASEITSLDRMVKDGVTKFSNGYSFKSIGIRFNPDSSYGNKYLMGHDSNGIGGTRYRFQEWFHWNGYWYNPYGY